MKRPFSFVFALIVALCTVSASGFVGGNGSAAAPYLISTRADIEAVNNDLDAYYKMVNDINFSGEPAYTTAVIAPDANPSEGYGYHGTAFTGCFDGNDNKIIGLTINNSENSYLGLFGYAWVSAVIKNLTLTNCDITGKNEVAALAGYNEGIIFNSNVTGEVAGEDDVGLLVGWNYGGISNCYTTGIVRGTGTGYSSGVGGCVGINIGNISNSYAVCSVLSGGEVGGFVGTNYCSLTNCYAGGTVSGTEAAVGGLVGYNNKGSLTNCYSTSYVSSTSVHYGGLVGGDWASSNSGIKNCFWDKQTSGQTTSDGGTGLLTYQMQLQSTFTDAGWDFAGETVNNTHQLWQIPPAGGYPELTVFDSNYTPPVLVGNGSKDSPYLVSNVSELGAIIHYDLHANYKLVDDINMADRTWSVAIIPVFAGDFNGNNHKISNLRIDGGGFASLFGHISYFGRVCDLILDNFDITANSYYAASAVSRNYGVLANISVAGSVESTSIYVGGLVGANYYGLIFNSSADGIVIGSGHVLGGLAGYNLGRITKSYANCSVSTDEYVEINYEVTGGLVGLNGAIANITNSYATGSVSGDTIAGGLAGENMGEIANCYSAGSVSADWFAGGLAGENCEGTLIQCYWDTQTSGRSVGYDNGTATSVEGLTTASMKTRSSYFGWDFLGESYYGQKEIWRMCVDGVDYPRMSWQFARSGDFACNDGVDLLDLLSLAEEWLTTRNSTPNTFNNACDANNDEVIDMYDFAVLGLNWL